jgi:hypothetical protein
MRSRSWQSSATAIIRLVTAASSVGSRPVPGRTRQVPCCARWAPSCLSALRSCASAIAIPVLIWDFSCRMGWAGVPVVSFGLSVYTRSINQDGLPVLRRFCSRILVQVLWRYPAAVPTRMPEQQLTRPQ